MVRDKLNQFFLIPVDESHGASILVQKRSGFRDIVTSLPWASFVLKGGRGIGIGTPPGTPETGSVEKSLGCETVMAIAIAILGEGKRPQHWWEVGARVSGWLEVRGSGENSAELEPILERWCSEHEERCRMRQEESEREKEGVVVLLKLKMKLEREKSGIEPHNKTQYLI